MAGLSDFILTISDNDEISLASDLESEAPAPATGRPLGKKRKRANAGPGLSRKRSKASSVEDQEAEDFTALSSNESDSPLGEVGYIDEDFEFQLEDYGLAQGGGDTGWSYEPADVHGSRGKRDVDLDGLIAKRRRQSTRDLEQSETGKDNSLSTNGDTQKYRSSVEEDGDQIAVGEALTDAADELLQDDAFGMQLNGSSDEEGIDDEFGVDEEDGTLAESDADSVASPLGHPDDEMSESEQSLGDDREEESSADAARKAAFFAEEEQASTVGGRSNIPSSSGFQAMNLSRPITRGLAALSFSSPTPIQSKTIPIALLGKDVVGGAVTGSGKTAAFIVPILERLMHRPKRIPTTRVVILTPTRELAIQCHAVAVRLASFTDISFALTVGGLSVKAQEAELKKRPDVVIATPGRFIDHMRNSASFAVESVEILVLDEADRMLEDGFADELDEILKTIPKSRQTMLFSATMTDSVDKLVRLGMNRPVRLLIDAKLSTVKGLTQEFVRIRPGREEKRLGYLIELVTKFYKQRTIIFFRKKADAHRVRIIFGLLGLQAGELHGSLSQEQRIRAIETFRDGEVPFLLATDLASRGLDIKGIDTVINFEAPQSHEIYLHRVGRTARAGRNGRSCTLATESDRKIVRQAVKSARTHGGKIISRVLENGVVDGLSTEIEALQAEVDSILLEEKEEKQMLEVETQLKRGENIVDHEEEIKNRPKRTWFESEQDKIASKRRGAEELNGPTALTKSSTKKGKKGMKLSGKKQKVREDREQRTEGRMWKKGKEDRSGAAKKPSKKPTKGSKTIVKARSTKKPIKKFQK